MGSTPDFWHRPGTAKASPERTSVEAPPEHHGDDSKPSPELAAVRKQRPFADGSVNAPYRPFADGVDGAPNGIKRAKMVVVTNPSEGKPSMGKSITELSSNTRAELDLAKTGCL